MKTDVTRLVPAATRPFASALCTTALALSLGLLPNVGRAQATTTTTTTTTDTTTDDRSKPAAVVAAPAATQTVSNDSALLTLNPFVVSSDTDVGYMAADTLAGSRLNTALKDTAASISVFTPEFMKDIGAFSVNDVMKFANNTDNDNDEGTEGGRNGNATVYNFPQYRVRGADATLARDYFLAGNVPQDTYNIDRIEQSRGANSVLFGIGSPAGIVNVATKQAETDRNFRDLTLAAGTYDSWRTAGDFNQVLLKNKLALRLNAVDYHDGGYRYRVHADGKFATLSAKYQVTPDIDITAQYEGGTLKDNSPRNDPLNDNGYDVWTTHGKPLFGLNETLPDAFSQIHLAGADWSRMGSTLSGSTLRFMQTAGNPGGQLVSQTNELQYDSYNQSLTAAYPNISRRINVLGPEADRDFQERNMTAFIHAKLLPGLFLEAGYNHLDYQRVIFGADNTQSQYMSVDADSQLPNGAPNPYAGMLFLETNWAIQNASQIFDRGRVALSFEHDFGKWGLYRAATDIELQDYSTDSVEKSEVYAGSPFNATPESSANQVIRRSYFKEGDYQNYYMQGPGLDNNLLIKDAIDPVTGRSFSSTYVTSGIGSSRSDQKGILVAMQAHYLGDHLIIGAGARRDINDNFSRDTSRNASDIIIEDPAQTGEKSTAAGDTYSLGAVAHVTKYLDLIYDISDNFQLPQAGLEVLGPTGVNQVGAAALESLPRPQGTNLEYGFAIPLADSRLYLKAVYFKTNATNSFGYSGATEPAQSNALILDGLLAENLITQADHDARYTGGDYVYLQDRSDEGYEVSLTANPTPNWRLQVNYSINKPVNSNIMASDVAWWQLQKAYYAKFANLQNVPTPYGPSVATWIQDTDDEITYQTSADGLGVFGFRKDKWNFFTRYSFTEGVLNHFYIGGGAVFLGNMLIGVQNQHTPQQYLQYSAKNTSAYGVAGYAFKIEGHPMSLQFNVQNLFNDTSAIVYRTTNPAGPSLLARNVEYPDPRSYRVTLDIPF
ncbi:MAG TPA: TonB-dependent receptor plug domain-containing protein [Opitutaceae bacterium]|jgi:outer membrane receptor protein involved in Fe transport|nr:TonB-dependent receptor plug domain-containing protein [Opitutaceae bacterium]